MGISVIARLSLPNFSENEQSASELLRFKYVEFGESRSFRRVGFEQKLNFAITPSPRTKHAPACHVSATLQCAVELLTI